ncbi:hypothetical protein GALMADRAFT_230005 [Galerina marginata CBS 339.88]|uniref:Uncharacterized protein n=1 Tax=Galerina marginata (strain CBS 339.88) TaxID=685588 RepID=A0A067SL12_GALM3|nr:hypothetical protein GALMADRAFT_230005 [Galerina marginata CBS 339.88]
MSRAGLTLFLLLIFNIGLTLCAPISDRSSRSSLVERYDDEATLDVRDFHPKPDPKLDHFSWMQREYDHHSRSDVRDSGELEGTQTKRDGLGEDTLCGRSIWGKIKKGIRKVTKSIKKGIHTVQSGVRKVGRTIKKGVRTVGRTIKKNIGKVAKIGLRVVATAATAVSKVAKFVPGIGTGIGLALNGVAMGANAAANKLHVRLGGLDKAFNVAMNPLGALGKGGNVASTVGSMFL